MKFRFFTLNGRKPAPGTIVNLRLHFDGKTLSEGGVLTHFKAIIKKPENSQVFELMTEISRIDGGLLIATSRTDHMGYGRIDFANLSDGYRHMVLTLLFFGLASRQAKLVLEIEGSAASAIDILEVRGLYALLHTRQEFKAALSVQNAALIATVLLDFISGADDAFYLQADETSATGPVGHVDDPDQKDYKLSPESFVSRRPIKTGEGNACEHLTPASLPLRQYSMYHVVVYDVATSKGGVNASIPSVNGTPPLDDRILWGQILEFEQEWNSLGHSLGEVKYSLALAPGEAIKIAVIDWQRNDTGSRLGANASVDKLTHDQTVDRDIDDIVKGRVTEQQSGSTFMAGLAGAMDFQIPQYGISAAGRHSIGYGTSNTEGKRDVSANAHQDVHLETLQRSNLVRSQNSSVIVQATQAESNYLSTRIVANMNRGHSLSILYYEVLRHLAVTTKFLRADTAILVPVDMFAFDANLARRFRAQLEQVLLDESYRVGFAALERIAAHVADVVGSDAPPVIDETTPVVTSNAVMASRFVVEFKTGWRWKSGPKKYEAPADTAGDIQVIARMEDGTTRTLIDTSIIPHPLFRASLEKFRTLSQLGAAIPNWIIRYEDSDGWCFAKFTADIPQSINIRDVQGFAIKWRPVQWPVPGVHEIMRNADGWNLNQASITVDLSSGSVVIGRYAFTGNSGELFGSRDNDDYVEQGINADLSGLPAPLPTSAPAPTTTTTTTTTTSTSTSDKKRELSSQQLADLLVNHLNANQYYYNSYVWLLMDPRERRQRISSYVGDLLVGMSDTPLAMSGNHLAFRYTSRDLPAAAQAALPNAIAKLMPKESIVTLPTRGIFAEAHMGHCNAAEKRDITRLWSFDELPVSLLPNIETLTAGPRGSYQGLAPDTMGSSPLGIQGTPDLSAPGEAIAKALELLAKPDIFRDQSTREQVAEIMGKLIESAQPPKLTGSNIGSAFGNGKASGSNGAVNDPSEWANPFPDRSKQSASSYDSKPTTFQDRLSVISDAVNNKSISAEDGKKLSNAVLRSFAGGTGSSTKEDAIGELIRQVAPENAARIKAQSADGSLIEVDQAPPSSASESSGEGGGKLGTMLSTVLGATGLPSSPLIPFDPDAPSTEANAAYVRMVTNDLLSARYEATVNRYIDEFGFDRSKRDPRPKIIAADPFAGIIRGKSIRLPWYDHTPSDVDVVIRVGRALGIAPVQVLALWIMEGKSVHDNLWRNGDKRSANVPTSTSNRDALALARSMLLWDAFGLDPMTDVLPPTPQRQDTTLKGTEGAHDTRFNMALDQIRAANVDGFHNRSNREIREYFTSAGGALRVQRWKGAEDTISVGLKADSLASWVWLQSALFEATRKQLEAHFARMYPGETVDLSAQPWVTYLFWNTMKTANVVESYYGHALSASEAIAKRFGSTTQAPEKFDAVTLSRYYHPEFVGLEAQRPQSTSAWANAVTFKLIMDLSKDWFGS